jgi:putative nucleotidyltransferase with HDIG domain
MSVQINRNPLSGFQVGISVDGWFLLTSSRPKTASNGNRYIGWEGLDARGMVVRGTLYPQYEVPVYEPGSVIWVKGKVGQGRNSILIYAESLQKITDPESINEFKTICYPTVPKEKLDKVIADLEAYSKSFSIPALLQLSTVLFDHFIKFLPLYPAAKLMHEPVRGGLAVHTWEVLNILNNQLLLDKGLDWNVLFFCGLYHDIGKTQEYTEDIQWAPAGRLLNHAMVAIELIKEFTIRNNIALPEVTYWHIKHCIQAHHGRDCGNEKPATREAIALHHADAMCAGIGIIDEQIRIGNIDRSGWAVHDSHLEVTPYVPQMDVSGTEGHAKENS